MVMVIYPLIANEKEGLGGVKKLTLFYNINKTKE